MDLTKLETANKLRGNINSLQRAIKELNNNRQLATIEHMAGYPMITKIELSEKSMSSLKRLIEEDLDELECQFNSL